MRFSLGLAAISTLAHRLGVDAAFEMVLHEDGDGIDDSGNSRYFHCQETDPSSYLCECGLTLQRDSSLTVKGGQDWSSGRRVNKVQCEEEPKYFQMKNDGNLVTFVGTGQSVVNVTECWRTSVNGAIDAPKALYIDGPETCTLHTFQQIWTTRSNQSNFLGANLHQILKAGESMEEPGTLYESNDCKVDLSTNSELMIRINGTISWRRGGEQSSHNASANISMMPDGNLVINNGNSKIWESNTTASGAHGLYIDEDCNLSIFEEIWTNIRTELKRLDILERGGKFAYTNYTLELQQNGTLVQTDNKGDTIWFAGNATEEGIFFLRLNEQGMMTLNVVNDKGEETTYWSRSLFESPPTNDEYVLTLGPNGPMAEKTSGVVAQSDTLQPSPAPSVEPSLSSKPSLSFSPSTNPTVSIKPSLSFIPSSIPSSIPSFLPTLSFRPSSNPTISDKPSLTPTSGPSASPSVSNAPTFSSMPSFDPTVSSKPSANPSSIPSFIPSIQPTEECCACLLSKGVGPNNRGCPECEVCERRVCDLDDFCCIWGWDRKCTDHAALLCNTKNSCASHELLSEIEDALKGYVRPELDELVLLFGNHETDLFGRSNQGEDDYVP